MGTRFQIDPSDPMPLYAQLERAIRLAIATEKLAAGDQLPTVRQLAVDLHVNANTVAKVYTDLERAGVVETRRGVGTFVRVRRAEAAQSSDRRRELRLLTDHFLAEAERLGFSLNDVLTHLQSRLKP